MSKIKILPYKGYSKSAKALKLALGKRRALIKRNTTSAIPGSLILNWGNSNPGFDYSRSRVINNPRNVATAINKLTALTVMRSAGVSVPDFTTDIAVAREWIEGTFKVVCRKLLSAHSGRGASIASTSEEVVPAPLYTKFIRKTKEFRVHVFNGRVIDYVQKKARSERDELPGYNRYIRSYNNGWIMSRTDITVSEPVKAEAIKAVAALGLDFGAVDIVLQDKKGVLTPFVLEVNTAIGLEGQTVTSYANAIVQDYLTPRR